MPLPYIMFFDDNEDTTEFDTALPISASLVIDFARFAGTSVGHALLGVLSSYANSEPPQFSIFLPTVELDQFSLFNFNASQDELENHDESTYRLD